MDTMDKLCGMLHIELEEITRKGQLSAADVYYVQKILSSLKNIQKLKHTTGQEPEHE